MANCDGTPYSANTMDGNSTHWIINFGFIEKIMETTTIPPAINPIY
jgi:hypothetical protein